MNLKDLSKQWDDLGKTDPLWAVLTWPEKKNNQWQKQEFFATGIKEIDDVLAYVEKLSLKVKLGSALDFGCGVGRLSQALVKHFERVDGVDIAPSMIELANAYNQRPEHCFYHLNDTGDLSRFVDESFDFIYSRLTLQHMEPRYAKEYIAEFARILKDGGIVVFQEPSQLKSEWKLIYSNFDKGLYVGLKRMLPKPWLNFFRYFRAKVTRQPYIEVYGIEQVEMKTYLRSLNFIIIEITQFGDAGPEWISYRYIATK